ncbi:hypothetical protein FA15DRAFT_657777 [Coprinopsis marcescibilis]|uniref:Transmembrane protein n=1 Tax=Coprinopsis marcescibilis TaxID=230819 RepID=A0A5C3KPV9_COPMA|nr:hypothetical protein FA15DRAFT_657777 [Coprinopsis marcescibilis]
MLPATVEAYIPFIQEQLRVFLDLRSFRDGKADRGSHQSLNINPTPEVTWEALGSLGVVERKKVKLERMKGTYPHKAKVISEPLVLVHSEIESNELLRPEDHYSRDIHPDCHSGTADSSTWSSSGDHGGTLSKDFHAFDRTCQQGDFGLPPRSSLLCSGGNMFSSFSKLSTSRKILKETQAWGFSGSFVAFGLTFYAAKQRISQKRKANMDYRMGGNRILEQRQLLSPNRIFQSRQ